MRMYDRMKSACRRMNEAARLRADYECACVERDTARAERDEARKLAEARLRADVEQLTAERDEALRHLAPLAEHVTGLVATSRSVSRDMRLALANLRDYRSQVERMSAELDEARAEVERLRADERAKVEGEVVAG